MIVERSGWSRENGCYCERYSVNNGIEIIQNGVVYKQLSPFKNIEKDWNNDDDCYTMYAALFEGKYGNEYYTPEDLVSLLEDENIEIKGIKKLSK